ncbi:MAG: hypothetical protein JNK56_18035 [Myxococcales bacterium]|nr:hypothetical protein [Myxococcales bacterium]
MARGESGLLERMIPASLRASHESRLRARTLVVGSLGLAALGLIIGVVRLMTVPVDVNVVVTLVTVLVLASQPALQYWTGSYRLPAGVLVALLLTSLPAYLLLLGVFPAPALLVYPVVPMIAAFFLGRRVGLVSALVLASATLALGSTQPTPDPALMTALARTFMAVACVATLMSAHMAWTYEGARHQAEDELRALNVALEEARRAAEAANRSKTEFLRHISHELRTPLNSVLGHGELLREELAELGQARLVTDVARISDASEHMLALINELLDISRIEAGGLELRVAPQDLGALVHSVAETMRPLVTGQDNTLRVALADGLPTVTSDGRRLRQVLLNLVGNACKFTERGEITIAAERAGADAVRLVVSDTGIGMTAAQLGRIFVPFVQVDESPERRDRGTGLGLAITRRIVELLGGTITVTSEPGRGSQFSVTLPIRGPVVV